MESKVSHFELTNLKLENVAYFLAATTLGAQLRLLSEGAPIILELVTSSMIACCSWLHIHDHRHWILPGLQPTHPAGLVSAHLFLQGGQFAPGGLEMGQNNSLIKLTLRPKMFSPFYFPFQILSCFNCPIKPMRDSAVKSNKNAHRNSITKMPTIWRCPKVE